MKTKAPNRSTGYIDENDRYYPCVPTPFGMIPLVSVTMTTERERELFGTYPPAIPRPERATGRTGRQE